MLRDEAIETLLGHLEKLPRGALEIGVENGVYYTAFTESDVMGQSHILSDALAELASSLPSLPPPEGGGRGE